MPFKGNNMPKPQDDTICPKKDIFPVLPWPEFQELINRYRDIAYKIGYADGARDAVCPDNLEK